MKRFGTIMMVAVSGFAPVANAEFCLLDIGCIDDNRCTDDKCVDFNCVHTPTDCDDNNVCTHDTCDPASGCRNLSGPLPCFDFNLCTIDSCDPIEGCRNEPVDCDDADPCTVDTCRPDSGCGHTPRDCDDGLDCTEDSCIRSHGGFCEHTEIAGACDDGNACTLDVCRELFGCDSVIDPDFCDDGIDCTTDACDPSSGCSHTANHQLCNDGIDCTSDACLPEVGCRNIPHRERCSDDGDACTFTQCRPEEGGCVQLPRTCDDDNVCTEDSCDSATGDPVTGCVFAPVDCDDGDACTVGSCDPAVGCQFTDLSCDDGIGCTIDSCDPDLGCRNLPRHAACLDTDACTDDRCEPDQGGCVHRPRSCDDGNACSVDSCDPASGCVYEAVSCEDGSKCTINTCDKITGCVSTDAKCDDGDACTTDSCDPASGCVYEKRECDDGDECTADSCKQGLGCYHEPLDCIDAVACSSNVFICKSVDYHDADGDRVIEVGEPTTFDVVIEVQNLSGGPWSGVVVSDRFGGEIRAAVTVMPDPNPTQGTVKIGAKGATQKQSLTWNIGNLPAGGSATLLISARTDVNPGGKQEYTSCGTHAFNSGAVLKYANTRQVKSSAATGVINLDVLTANLAGDCDGDGASDSEEISAGTNPLDANDFPPPPGTCNDGSQPVENCIGSGDVAVPCCSVPNGTTCSNGQPNYECFANGVNVFCCEPN